MLARDLLECGSATLPQLLAHNARQFASDTALREKHYGVWKAISWEAYYRQARWVALGLQKLGLGRGDRIIIASDGTPEWFYADLGAQMLGVQVVGIYPTNPWAELQYIARHSGARAAICGDQEQTDKVLDAMRNGDGLPRMEHVYCVDLKGLKHYEPGLPGSFADLLKLGRDAESGAPQAAQALDAAIGAIDPDDIAILVYTSGTTGPPKGAMLSHRNLVYAAYAYASAVGLDKTAFEAVCYLPLCHAAERVYSTVQHLVLGGIVNFAESIDTVALNIREIGPTFFLGVPRIWEKLQHGFLVSIRDSGPVQKLVYTLGMHRGRALVRRRLERAGRATLWQRAEFLVWYWLLFRNMQRHTGLSRSRVRLCGGASVSPETLLFFNLIGLEVGQGYGLTESGGLSFAQRPDRVNIPGQCGPALPGTEWKVAEDGEIFIRSPGVFAGYLDDAGATAQVLSPEGWLASGDIVETRADGEISIVDRKKAIIITSGGKNISPSEIEDALKESIYIKEAIVVGEGRKFLGALIQVDFETVGRWASDHDLQYTTYKSLSRLPETGQLIQSIVNKINERFARVENIRKFVILEKELDHDDGELTATQKVRRGVIEKKFANELVQIYGQ